MEEKEEKVEIEYKRAEGEGIKRERVGEKGG